MRENVCVCVCVCVRERKRYTHEDGGRTYMHTDIQTGGHADFQNDR